MRLKCAEIEDMSTETPCWCQVTGKEQLAASAPAHGPFRRGSAAGGTKAGSGRWEGGGGRKTARGVHAKCQEVPVSLSHLLLHPHTLPFAHK